MQNVLLIHDQPLIPAAICDALAQRYKVRNALEMAQARELAQTGQVVMLALADIHASERLCLLRELLVLGYIVVLLPGKNEALTRACNRFDLIQAAIHRGYFVGLYLIFPRGLNVQTGDAKVVDGRKKYQILL